MHDFLGNAALLLTVSVGSAFLFTRLFNGVSSRA